MSTSADQFDESDCVCSFGMKLTWDINDPELPQDIQQYDDFQEWTDGYVRYIYSAEDKNAQRHLSGWAMRNTNNHNCQILKKSCLGVVVCNRSCSLSDGNKLQLRPAICDKARQKQQKPYKLAYDSPSNAGEATSSLQKASNHRIYMTRPPCGYEFSMPGYLGSGSYPALYKDSGNPQPEPDSSKVCMQLGGSQHNLSPLNFHERNYDTPSKHHGWKQILGKGGYGERSEYGQIPANTNHHYYNGEYPCRYGGPAPANTPALQTIITTTTKVSYQPCKPSVVKYNDNLCDVKNLQNCNSLLENGSATSYPEIKVPEDTGVIKSALAYQPETLSTKTERADSLENYRYGNYSSSNYPERIAHPFRYENGEY
ncbi:UNVERIFIED_CONTAM: hypothetical protein FKN15_022801 [Acipenser sinensis]